MIDIFLCDPFRVVLNVGTCFPWVVQVQATAGISLISGVALPVFTNREVSHEIRLTEGETNILGGLITESESTAIAGIPGLAQVPILKYLFASETSQRDQTEIIVLLTPHIRHRCPACKKGDIAAEPSGELQNLVSGDGGIGEMIDGMKCGGAVGGSST